MIIVLRPQTKKESSHQKKSGLICRSGFLTNFEPTDKMELVKDGIIPVYQIRDDVRTDVGLLLFKAELGI